MTTYLGNRGVVKVGSSPVAEVKRFTVDETEAVVDDTALGDAAPTHVPDELPRWTGTIECHHFPGDTSGQAVLLVGDSVNLELSPIGTANGREKLSGAASITSRAISGV